MARKRADRYHHGDLSRSLLKEALRTIEKDGVAALTMRAVGAKLGVSRTALYRHFADKSALLSAVATEGFRTLRIRTSDAWDRHGGGREGMEAMGEAYVRFAVEHPSHYRVMFGGHVRNASPDSDLATEGAGAFQVLVDALVAQQRDGLVRNDPPLALAQYIWANVHGIAMLAIDGQLKQPIADVIRFANERMRTGIESTHPKRRGRVVESGGVGESGESKESRESRESKESKESKKSRV
jgi:AcrR family transcriptional regulator